MDDIKESAKALLEQVNQATSNIDFDAVSLELQNLTKQQNSPDFWADNLSAQKTMQQISKLQNKIEPWQQLKASLIEIIELSELGDESVKAELSSQLKKANDEFIVLKKNLMYSGPYDDYNAIISIYAGAGGTDAQDWAQMLMRMYLRWAEQEELSASVVTESSGEEAGIKSATLEISGPLVYGKLKGEHGVHRLVRLSPFNSDNLRQTSFAKVDVLPEIDKPDDILIDEKDLKIDVYRAGGHGGQSVNTTDSAVRITHLPTGITVAIQNERSQLQNKETALTILRSRLAQLQLEQHQENLAELKGPNEQAAWGNQIRNYVMHPYTMVKDTRTKAETSDVQSVLDGDLSKFINTFVQ
jgi:peptide chain release factor 2